jgi:predicted AlkP superfamily phosphohydrolase/phosphomutase
MDYSDSRNHLVGGRIPQRYALKSSPRVMVIGLDSADADLIEQWCAEGYLPTLQSLRQQGIWGRLGTTAEVMHVSAWPSIYTGTLPGKHGMYHAYQIKSGEQGVHRTRADECGQPPFWKFLDEAGKCCIVMDVFMNYPLQGFRGIQILEYGTWTWFSQPLATPDGVWKEILSKFGHYPVPEHSKVLSVPEPYGFRKQLLEGAALKARVVRSLMREKPWDMFFVTFGEPHPAGHYLWHFADPWYPAHLPGNMAGLEHALRDVYVAVDTAIGEILREVDDSVSVVVTSGDGMGPNYSGCHLVPEVLSRLGLYYAVGVGQVQSPLGEGRGSTQRKRLASVVRGMVPLSVRRVISRCMPRHLQHQLSMKWANANTNWSRTRAFCIPNSNEAYIRLNLKGREPQGIVARGAAYTELISELQMHLKALVNPQSGRLVTRQVVCNDDVFPGPRRDDLPDIVVNWDIDAKVLSEMRSDRCGLIKGQATGYEITPYYTGNHKPAAFVLARGPLIAEDSTFTGGHVIDIAPTIMAMLGVDPPVHLDGRIWSGFIGHP